MARAYALSMLRPAFVAALTALLAMALSPLNAAPAAPAAPDPELRAELHCAAAFAIAASEQARGSAVALALPPLKVRGKRYFADVGERAVGTGGLSREAVQALLTDDVIQMQRRAAADPDKTLAAEVKPCLARLDAAVPPLKVPDLAQCAAIMGLAHEEERARDPQSPAARDLQTLAQVLGSRARTALLTGGLGGDSADAALAEAREAMRREAQDQPGGIDTYAIAHCYDLAAPDAKSHY